MKGLRPSLKTCHPTGHRKGTSRQETQTNLWLKSKILERYQKLEENFQIRWLKLKILIIQILWEIPLITVRCKRFKSTLAQEMSLTISSTLYRRTLSTTRVDLIIQELSRHPQLLMELTKDNSWKVKPWIERERAVDSKILAFSIIISWMISMTKIKE